MSLATAPDDIAQRLQALEGELAQRSAELAEAVTQQAATADVLRAISGSAFDLDTVLTTLIRTSIQLCEATRGVIWLSRDGQLFLAAHFNYPAEWVAFAESMAITPAADAVTTSGLAAFTGEVVNVEDVLRDPRFQSLSAHKLGDYRAGVAVPMKRDGKVVGVISLSRPEARLFSDRQLELLQTFADQAVIAIENSRLLAELEAKNRDVTEALEQQTATAEVLKTISGSAFDLDAVLHTLVQSASDLCHATSGCIYLREGDVLQVKAQIGWSQEFDEYIRANPTRPGRHSASARVALTGSIVHIPDVLADPEYTFTQGLNLKVFRTVLGVPLLRDGSVTGAFVLTRPMVQPFTQREIELVQTFADQAVIAIENVRLFDEVEAKNRDLTEALEQQVATGAILRAIAGSPTDIQPVLKTVAENAAQLCDAFDAVLMLRQGEVLVAGAHYGPIPFDFKAWPVGRDWVTGRAVFDRETVHVHDLKAEAEEFPAGQAMSLRLGHRTILATPLIREGDAIGALVIRRTEVRPFSDKQIELLKTFADQSVIAIENVRLFEEVQARTAELGEALEQQTATADVLKVISRSAFDLTAVLQTLIVSAANLCAAERGGIYMLDGDVYRLAAEHGMTPELRAFEDAHPTQVGRDSWVGRTALEKAVVHVPDTSKDLEYGMPELPRIGDFSSILCVPLMREGVPIGVLGMARIAVGPFTERQIEVVRTFADQAVIAIENVRLFDEVQARTADLSEALRQQTATADVLKVISRSAFDLQMVLDTLVESATQVCEADKGVIFQRQGDLYHLAANFGFSPGFEDYAKDNPHPAGSDSITGRVALHARTIHIHDVLDDPDYKAVGYQRRGEFRTALGVPLLREGFPIGVFVLTRPVVRPFTEKQIELVVTFADQAVIAIENVRLFDEVQARTAELSEALQQQLATADVLQVISRATFNLPTVLDTLVSSAIRLCNSTYGVIYLREGDALAAKALVGATPADAEIIRGHRLAFDRRTISGRTALTGTAQNVPDVLADPEYEFPTVDEENSVRAVLAVPLVRDNKVDGVFFIGKAEPGSFTDRQRELVQTFADQAVIAIENVRLFEELQAKTRDLEEALTFQKATSDVLEVIGRSASQLQPVLDIIVETAATLCRADMSVLRLLRDGGFHLAASNNRNDVALAMHSQRHVIVPDRSSVAGRVALDGRTIHIHDVAIDPEYTFLNAMGELPVHTTLGVPLTQDGVVVGVIILLRKDVDPFTERQIALVQTFADQAVIALANVQLFDKVEARTRDLARSLDDLRAAQNRLIQTEKLASLGQLTAGIAHEIKNPLNFVSNFSSLSVELIGELGEVLAAAALDDDTRAEVRELAGLLKGNLDKVVQHGKRADSIVKNMLLHSREGSGEHRLVDVNAVVEESFNLAYHGARAEKPGFNVTLKIDLDPDAGDVDLYPQEITRVLLNLISNGFYATSKRAAESSGAAYEPVLAASTRNLGDSVEIRIRDNGTGIPPEVKEKMFNPFFTTKPAGEGTGLGLSLSHDIIVKQHAGTIEVDTEPGLFTEFRIVLPRGAASLAKSGGRA